jgi:type I restriction enzyme S subunit
MITTSQWELVPLGEIVENKDLKRVPIKESDRAERHGIYPYYGASGIIDYVDEYIFEGAHLLIGEDGANLIARSSPIAFIADGKFWVNNHAHVLGATERVELKYLAYFFETLDLKPYVTGSAQPKLTRKSLDRIIVPLPPIAEQKRIAAILDKAEELRGLRRKALEELDAIVQSIFLEMFGDLKSILGKWTNRKLGELLDFLTTGSRGWAAYYASSGDLFLRIQNVRSDELLLNDVAYVKAPDTAEAKRTRVQAGDVLISMTADLGRAAVIPEGLKTAYINQHLAILRTKALVPRFLSAYLTSPLGQQQALGRNRQGVKAGLNFDDVRSFVVPVPPFTLQQEFAHRVEAIERLKVTHRESLAQLDALFASLQHRAFRGEL